MKSNDHPSPPSLSQGSLHAWGKSPGGEVSYWEWTGKITDRKTVCYRIRLPHFSLPDFPPTWDFFVQLRDAFLLYLQEESKQEGELRFGGMDFFFSENRLILSYAFCPFGRRSFFPVLRLTLSPDGALQRIQRCSRTFNGSTTPAHPAKDSPWAKENPINGKRASPSAKGKNRKQKSPPSESKNPDWS